jgi:DNA polymerase-1
MSKKPILVLIDGSAVFHRGYHAVPHLSTRDGLPTNATLGFANILLRILGELKPTYVIVTWDKSSKTFRKELYPEYKANRVKQPDDLYAQIPTTHEFVDAMNIPWIELDNYEADDIIGTLARQAEERGDLDIVIATGDKDQLQLVDKSTVVDMFNPRTPVPTRYDLAKMKEKYDLTPLQFIDYKALIGDPSDNIPGVLGIGDVGARKLLAAYKTLDGIYEHIDEITGGIHDKLVANKEMAYLSRKLSVIVLDAPITLDLEPAKIGDYDRERVHELFRRLEFKSLLSKLPDQTQASSTAATGAGLTLFGEDNEIPAKERAHLKDVEYRTVTSLDELNKITRELEQQEVFAIDTETTSVDTMEARLVGISVSYTSGRAVYIPIGHSAGEQLTLEQVIQAFKPILENAAIGKTGHNIKYDYEVLSRHGIQLEGVVFDTMIAAFLLNSLGRSQSLDDLTYAELGFEMIPISELIGSGRDQITFDLVPIDVAATYAAEDADMSWRLYEILNARLKDHAEINSYGWSMDRLARDIEWPIIPVLGTMELAGIGLDVPQLRDFGVKLTADITRIKEEVYKLAGEEFNLGSPAQLAQILYGRLGLPTAGLKKGKTGYSTAAGELEKLRHAHPMVELIMQFREYDKLKNTYVDALPELVKSDNRIHTSFNLTIAQTGRLSSTNPNLQNIPVRSDLGRQIRAAFIAPEGRTFISADYSQIELRVAAALSQDPAMLATFRAGQDLHVATAAELYGIPLADVTKDQRYAAKTINFGVLYGMSAHGLSVATDMDPKEAGEFIKRYFGVRPMLAQYIESTKQFGYDHEYTETFFGRRRPCSEIRSNNFQIRSGAERMAVNVPIQGTAADIIKLAMVALAPKLPVGAKLLLQIHDELIVEIDEKQANEVTELVRDTMENIIDIGVPLVVDTAIGSNWGEL